MQIALVEVRASSRAAVVKDLHVKVTIKIRLDPIKCLPAVRTPDHDLVVWVSRST